MRRRPGRRRNCAACSSASPKHEAATRKLSSRRCCKRMVTRSGRVLGGRVHEPRGEASAAAVRSGLHSGPTRPRRGVPQRPDANIEELAVEIKRFHGISAQTLVAAGHRQTAAGTRGPGRPGQRLTRESFLDGFEDDAVRGVA